MGQTARFQEVLRRLEIIDDSLVETQAGLAIGLAEAVVLNPKTAALVQVGAMLARDTWTMARILDRWATGPGTEGMDFAAAVAGAGAALGIGLADGDRDRALSEADEALSAALARQVPRVRAA